MDLSTDLLSRLDRSMVEEFIGIRGYASSTVGVGGVIKEKPDDFKTWEILVNGLDARRAYEEWREYRAGYGDLTLCVLKKIGIDTIRASSIISRALGVKPKMIGFCGIKDKMSISWQFITTPRGAMSPDGLEIDKIIDVKPVEDTGSKLTSRSLLKNVFEIRIRHARIDVDEVERCVEELKARGVPNFYGHQRFGITRPITAIVGKLIMEDRLEEAVKAFLSAYSPLEGEENRLARMNLRKSWDLEDSLNTFPKSLRYEREIMKYLVEKPGDYAGALRTLPLRLRRLMVESVAALAFNKALSRILAEGKLMEPELGDYVIPLSLGGRPEKDRYVQVRSENLETVKRLLKMRRLVIALPVPGYLSNIPRSWKGEVLREALEELGIELNMFRVRSLPETSTRGTLRPIIIPRWDIEILSHTEDELLLKLSLPPGSYATIVLREIMKSSDPLAYIGRVSDSLEELG